MLNFVQTDDLQLYDRFGVDGVQNLCHIVDYQRSAFLTFDQFKPKDKLNNCMHYYSLISNIPIEVKMHTHNEDFRKVVAIYHVHICIISNNKLLQRIITTRTFLFNILKTKIKDQKLPSLDVRMIPLLVEYKTPRVSSAL